MTWNLPGRVRVAVVGWGFMGVTHARAYLRAARMGIPCHFEGVVDPSVSSLEPPSRFPLPPDLLAQLEPVTLFRSLDELVQRVGVHAVSICTPTDTHAALAAAALESGTHVLIEKPVSLAADEIDALDALARRNHCLCMPAMCIRFWPAWALIADAIRDGRYGAVRRASFHRLACPPDWAPFYADYARSGGPLFDLHIHDADFIFHALGAPTSVEMTGDPHHFTTRYAIPAHPGAEITAEASWAQTPEQGFVMRCVVEFEEATLDFDFGRSPQLVLDVGGVRSSPPLPDFDGYDGEVRAFLGAIGGCAGEPPATLAQAAAVTRILHAERRSLETGRPIPI